MHAHISSLTGHTELPHAQQAVTRGDLVAEAQTDLRRGEGHARGVVIQQTSTHTYIPADRQADRRTNIQINRQKDTQTCHTYICEQAAVMIHNNKQMMSMKCPLNQCQSNLTFHPPLRLINTK